MVTSLQMILHAPVNNRKWILDCIVMDGINNDDDDDGYVMI
jgi:hypothetical protein